MLKNRVAEEIETAIVALAIEQPAFRQVRVANKAAGKPAFPSLHPSIEELGRQHPSVPRVQSMLTSSLSAICASLNVEHLQSGILKIDHPARAKPNGTAKLVGFEVAGAAGLGKPLAKDAEICWHLRDMRRLQRACQKTARWAWAFPWKEIIFCLFLLWGLPSQGWMWAVVPVINMLYIAIQAIELQLQYRDHARLRVKDPASWKLGELLGNDL